MKNLLILFLLCNITRVTIAQNIHSRQKIDRIGDLTLQSGKKINDCKIGYLTFGKLNADKSNALLFPSWLLGKSQQIAALVRPWQFIDTTRYYIMITDALANGVSSSPSNSLTQHGPLFPAITIVDMVQANHQLLVQKLGIRHLHAIIGASMGAFQAYQWAVSYPGFMDCIIPIFGSPKLSSYDIIHTQIIKTAIDENVAFNHGNYKTNPAIPIVTMILTLASSTPANIVNTMPLQTVPNYLQSAKASSPADWNDFRTQFLACGTQDISRAFKGSLTEAAKHIKARMLIVNNPQDHLVNPLPAIGFSKTAHAKLLIVDNALGHTGMDYTDKNFKRDVTDILQDHR